MACGTDGRNSNWVGYYHVVFLNSSRAQGVVVVVGIVSAGRGTHFKNNILIVS